MSSESDLLSFGKKLQFFRKQTKMSQAILALRAGVTQPTISQFENGERAPREETVRNIARVLDVGPGELIGELPHRKVVEKALGGLSPAELQQVLEFISFIRYKREYNG